MIFWLTFFIMALCSGVAFIGGATAAALCTDAWERPARHAMHAGAFMATVGAVGVAWLA